MKKNLLKLFLIILLALTLISPTSAGAQEYDASGRLINRSIGEFNQRQADSPAGQAAAASARAAACDNLTGIGKIICKIHQILNSIIPVLVALGVIYFIWGVVQYVIGDDGEAKKKGKDGIIYGIIGLAVIIGLWGLVNIVVTTFSLAGTMPALPTTGTTTGTGVCPMVTKNQKFQDLLEYFTCLINKSIIPFIFALAMVMFIWGVVQFVINSSEEAKKEKGRQFMIWGIIALTVMVSVWGLVNIVGGTFGLENVIPQVKP